jgi:hypothetical protein
MMVGIKIGTAVADLRPGDRLYRLNCGCLVKDGSLAMLCVSCVRQVGRPDSTACNCHLRRHQVCDICQGVDAG